MIRGLFLRFAESVIPLRVPQEVVYHRMNPALIEWLEWEGPKTIPKRLFEASFNMDANRAFLASRCSDEDLAHVAMVMLPTIMNLSEQLEGISTILNNRPIFLINRAMSAFRAVPSTDNLVKLVDVLSNPNMYPATIDNQLVSLAKNMGVQIIPDFREWESTMSTEAAKIIPWVSEGLSPTTIGALRAADITADKLEEITPPKSAQDGSAHISAISKSLEIVDDSAERSVLVSNIEVFTTRALQHATHELSQFLVADHQ